MAEFNSVMKQWQKMCNNRECSKCDLKKTTTIDNLIYNCSELLLYDPVTFEQKVMQWAKDNPNLQYPTWSEWQEKMFPNKTLPVYPCMFDKLDRFECSMNKCNTCVTLPASCKKCTDKPIPEDIAKKLGIKPKQISEIQSELNGTEDVTSTTKDKKEIAAIVAIDANWGIGYKGNLLFNIPEDMKRFKQITTDNYVIMGRKTYDSLPVKPLPNRNNIVITSDLRKIFQEFLDLGTETDKTIKTNNPKFINIEIAKNWLSQLRQLKDSLSKSVYIIGGGVIYKELLPFCDRVYVTKVACNKKADTYFPNLDTNPGWILTYKTSQREFNGIKYQFCVYNNFAFMATI